MDVVVKVILEQKEYERLLEIERKYTELLAHEKDTTKPRHQTGSGGSGCHCADRSTPNVPLSQVIIENTEAHGVKKPLPGSLPSITTTPLDDNREEEGESYATPSTSKSSEGKSHKKNFDHETGFYDGSEMYPWYFIGMPRQ